MLSTMETARREEAFTKVSVALAAVSPVYFVVLFIGVLPAARDRVPGLDQENAGMLYQLLGTHIELGVLLFSAAICSTLGRSGDRRLAMVYAIVLAEAAIVVLAAAWALLTLIDLGPLTIGGSLVAATAAGTVPQVALVGGAVWLCAEQRRASH